MPEIVILKLSYNPSSKINMKYSHSYQFFAFRHMKIAMCRKKYITSKEKEDTASLQNHGEKEIATNLSRCQTTMQILKKIV